MIYSFNAQIGQIHAILAWASVTLFLVRGLAFQFGAGFAVMAMDTRLQTLMLAASITRSAALGLV